ncbi:GNAT family N-acetyltransferase [Rhizobium deserti]|uniref:GNAT family N-acetyltransferase n=1 Tax=Rhizobium deserti TaxID=2547961 RepID=A0A4R5UHV0_9HYPH|nr:GNAT family N-acetyltransferase [Rhizobium deserti]TDK35543.1 GNAT family N-acetyltransferase [Rhizobium deserti]
MIEISRIDGQFRGWDELLALILSSFAYMEGVIDPPSSAHRLTLALLAQKARDEMAFIAKDGRSLVGCIFLKLELRCVYVGKLAVAPDRQGKGIGRRLLDVAETVAREHGVPALRLETRIELAANHAGFFRWGFLKTGENSHPGYARVTSIEMTKQLG